MVSFPGRRVSPSGQTGSGKTYLARHLATHWRFLYQQRLDKVTILYRTDQPEIQNLIRELPSDVLVVKRKGELSPEDLEPERLASPGYNGHSLVLIDNQLQSFLAARPRGDLASAFTNLCVVSSHHSRVGGFYMRSFPISANGRPYRYSFRFPSL